MNDRDYNNKNKEKREIIKSIIQIIITTTILKSTTKPVTKVIITIITMNLRYLHNTNTTNNKHNHIL